MRQLVSSWHPGPSQTVSASRGGGQHSWDRVGSRPPTPWACSPVLPQLWPPCGRPHPCQAGAGCRAGPAECGWKDTCLESDLDSPSTPHVSQRTPARGPGAQTHVHTHAAHVPGSRGFLHAQGKAGLAGHVSGLRCLSETSASSPGWTKGHSADQGGWLLRPGLDGQGWEQADLLWK